MKSAIAGILMGVLAAGCAAEASAGDLSLSVTPTVGGHTFSPKEHLVTRPAFGGKLGLSFLNDDGTDGISLEGTFDFVHTSSKQNGETVDAFIMLAEAVYPVANFGPLSPFVAAGGGLVAFTGPGRSDGKSPLLDYGLGARYYITDDIALRTDLRHLIAFDDRVGNRSNFQYTAGVNFFFGGDRKKIAAAPAAVERPAPAPTAEKAPVPAPPAAPVPAEPAPEPAPLPEPPPLAEQAEPAPVPAPADGSLPAAAAPATVLSSVRIEADGIRITFTEPVGSFETFTLSAPPRLVLDIPGAINGTEMKKVPVNRFGISAVRIGSYRDKCRIVLDSAKKVFPEYGISRDPRSLRIFFPK